MLGHLYERARRCRDVPRADDRLGLWLAELAGLSVTGIHPVEERVVASLAAT